MKIKLEILLDADDGTWDLVVRNLSNPGEPMDYMKIRRILRDIVGDVDRQVLGDGGQPREDDLAD